MQKNKNRFNYLYLPLLGLCAQASADYQTDIGYNQLKDELIAAGIEVPNGNGVNVTQVEAFPEESILFAPNPNVPALSGKTFDYPGVASAPTSFSSHATGVAINFYSSVSMAPGVNNIDSYEVNQWLNTLDTLNNFNRSAASTDRRIANHSWVSTNDSSIDGAILRSVDRQVARNEYIQVAATSSKLLSNAYNVISVGLTSSNTNYASSAIDSTYIAGRATTDLVAPAENLSSATPIVSAAGALLVQTGHQQTGLSHGSINVNSNTIYNAERAETVKAVLMTGADRETDNTVAGGNISDYRSTGHQTTNGLDSRYGAGQINVYNSYRILTAGEQDSLQDGGSGQIGMQGFDYDPAFGGSQGSNTEATYSFTAFASETISASLVWNAEVANNGTLPTTTLHHLGLSLYDITDGNNSLVAESVSSIDNTQNIFWQNLIKDHDYQLLVSPLQNSNFEWDYSLAWNRSLNATPVPLPAAFWLFGSALASLLGYQRKSRHA